MAADRIVAGVNLSLDFKDLFEGNLEDIVLRRPNGQEFVVEGVATIEEAVILDTGVRPQLNDQLIYDGNLWTITLVEGVQGVAFVLELGDQLAYEPLPASAPFALVPLTDFTRLELIYEGTGQGTVRYEVEGQGVGWQHTTSKRIVVPNLREDRTYTVRAQWIDVADQYFEVQTLLRETP